MNAEAAAEVKTCLHCPKKLRSDNMRGICNDCAKSGKKDLNDETINERAWRQKKGEAGGAVVKLPRATRRVQPPPKRSAGADLTALERFRIVADALRPGGKTADEVLEDFAQSYLDELGKAAEADD